VALREDAVFPLSLCKYSAVAILRRGIGLAVVLLKIQRQGKGAAPQGLGLGCVFVFALHTLGNITGNLQGVVGVATLVFPMTPYAGERGADSWRQTGAGGLQQILDVLG